MRSRTVVAVSLAIGVLAVVTVGSAVNAGLGSWGGFTESDTSSAADEAADGSTNPPPFGGNDTGASTACPYGAGELDPPAIDEPVLVALYPNPTTENNVGEYVVLETPNETSVAGWTLTDGHTTAALPNETVDGRVALTINAEATANLTDEEPLELEGHLRLAVDGDSLELRDGGTVLDAVAYERAPLAERWYRENGTDAAETDHDDGPIRGTWWPKGASCLAPTIGNETEGEAFVLPDAPDVALETIRDADDRIFLAGYTFTSESIATELLEAADSGVNVRVLVESSPVGGTPAETESILTALEAGGVEVRTIGGQGARYAFHHPKYVVADETALVTTENWKPAGIGGGGSRGWGIALEDADLAEALVEVFRADFEGPDTESSDRFLERATFVEDDDRPEREFSPRHDAEIVGVDAAELLVAPDNAEHRLLELLAAAEDEVLVKQVRLGGSDVSLVEAILEAARRGVEVQILLDFTWYVEDENQAIAEELEAIAAEEGLSIHVKLVEPDGRFEKIHAKGIVIDGEMAIVGSLNWNQNALENNREVLLVLHGEDAAAYYTAVFEDDWRGNSWPIPIDFSLAVVAALLTAAVVGHRYVTFGDEHPDSNAASLGSDLSAPENGPFEGLADHYSHPTSEPAPVTVVPNTGDVTASTAKEGDEDLSEGADEAVSKTTDEAVSKTTDEAVSKTTDEATSENVAETTKENTTDG